MRRIQSHFQTAAFIGTFALSTVLAGSMASAQQQQQMRSSQMQPQRQQQQMFQDEFIKDRIERRLARSAALAGTDITVNIEDRVATLQGVVGSEQEQERAIQLARRIRGVREVKSDLSVDKNAVEQRRNVQVDDDVLEQRVANKLAEQTFPLAEVDEGIFGTVEVDGYNWEFEVEADNGVITLDGDVDSYGDITEAIRAARTVPGVRAVVSDLRVDRDYFGTYGMYPYYHPYYSPYGYDPMMERRQRGREDLSRR